MRDADASRPDMAETLEDALSVHILQGARHKVDREMWGGGNSNGANSYFFGEAWLTERC